MNRRNKFLFGTILFISILASGCASTIRGTPQSQMTQAGSSTDRPRQTDSRGVPLPFVTEFYDRWNPANSGSTYEPCTALSKSDLLSLGLDPNSVKDAAVVDGQTARGCSWFSVPPTAGDLYVHQTVGNSPSLQAYKKKYKNIAVWRSDLMINGRQVGLEEDVMGGCTTYVQSAGAGVVTGTTSSGNRKLSLDDQCARALEFTRATIVGIPE